MATIRRQTDGGRYPIEERSQGVDESQQRAPARMEQIENGRLPKELIDNLEKIETLPKHVRGEIS
jgi:hypothetical protein